MSNLFSQKIEINYNGIPLEKGIISFDTETVLIENNGKVPELVLCSASDGNRTIVFSRSQMVQFLNDHNICTLAFHNAAFDVLVIAPYYPKIFDFVDANRVGDTMILDMLLRLSVKKGELDTTDSAVFPRSLDKVTATFGKELSITELPDKSSPYRIRFGELLGIDDLNLAPRGFLEYAATDASTTVALYKLMNQKALTLSKEFGVTEEVINTYGPLSHFLQVKAAIALYQISLNGIPFDKTTAQTIEEELRKSLLSDISWMDENYPGLFKRQKKGEQNFIVASKSQLPAMNTNMLRKELDKICEELDIVTPKSDGKNPELITVKGAAWQEFREQDLLIDKFVHFKEKSRIIAFFDMFKNEDIKDNRIRSRYGILTRTGRTSSSDVNLQNIPNKYEFKTIFKPTSKYLVTIDYSAIELRTLAFICESMYGHSVMGEKIRAGVDLHSYTAASINSIPYEDFVNNSSDKKYKKLRQEAKAANFGFPGGLGIDTFIVYAETKYGVVFTKDQAVKFRNNFLKNVFPEIGRYLQEDLLTDLSQNLAVPFETCAKVIAQISITPKLAASTIASVLKNPGTASAGNRNKVHAVLEQLLFCSLNPPVKIKQLIKEDKLNPELYDLLFCKNAITATGRIRSGCAYTQSKNTPFQGLASDGAKLALYKLIKNGYKVCAFVHDEVVAEVDSQEEAYAIKKIMEEEMSVVMNNTMPVECSLKLSACWEK
jgi:DNA polymerase I-like protein with 3'-5' exonuclease and polymerase domains